MLDKGHFYQATTMFMHENTCTKGLGLIVFISPICAQNKGKRPLLDSMQLQSTWTGTDHHW